MNGKQNFLNLSYVMILICRHDDCKLILSMIIKYDL